MDCNLGIACCRVDESDGTVDVTITGEVDFVTAPEIRAALEGLGAPLVRFDLAGVTFFDAKGVQLLEDLRLRLGAAFVLGEVSPQVRRILDLVEFDRMVAVA